MSSVHCDVEGLMVQLQQLGDRATKGVSDVMRDEAEKIAKIARGYAPRDKEGLEDSIVVAHDNAGINRRLQMYVFVDEDYVGENGRVGEYARLMHEHLAPYGSGLAGDVYNPKYPNTESKKKVAEGYNVGGKFLERAVRDRYDFLMQRVFKVVHGVFK